MALTFAKIAATFQLQKNIANRYFFFNIKSSFEAAFRSCLGCLRGDCDSCRSGRDCLTRNIFSQELSADPAAIKKYQKPSLPFAFHFPILDDMPNKGTLVEVQIILIGTTAQHYGHFLQALSTLVQGSMALVKAEAIDYGGNRYQLVDDRGIAHPDCLFLFSSEELQNGCRQFSDKVAVHVTTPLFLLRESCPLRELSFSPFIRSLFRRVSSLAYYYCGWEIDCDFKRLAEESLTVETVESSLSWTDWTGIAKGAKVSGITGRVVFSGQVEYFLPFLLLGQYFNAGKGASYGRGRYLLG